MKKIARLLVAIVLTNTLSIAVFAQSATISGNVKNKTTKDNAAAVSVTIKGSDEGTFTDDKGQFSINVKNFPVTLIFTSIGFEPQEVVVKAASDKVAVLFVPANTLGQEVVISASRVAEKIMESAVSIERITAANIRSAPAASYYDVVSTMKGVDVVTSSLTFKTPTTRGFNGSGNTRFNQIVDGMDNQAPGLNFSVGGVIGLTQLDVESMELLPGASSALYGPGGMNGTLLVNSKNPFKYQGLSFEVKTGVMHTDQSQRGASAYHNWSLRWAKKVSDKFAFKITSEVINARDWSGVDYRNYKRLGTSGAPKEGTRLSDPNYDGINVYGDETTADIRGILVGIGGQAPFLMPFINTLIGSPIDVSRTGYKETDIIDPVTVNYKLGGSLNYKITNNLEAVLAGSWGTGNTVYTGSDRYSLKDMKMGQYKFELLSKNWFLRGYTTQENAGQSYNATITTRLTNEAWKKSITYAPDGVTPAPQATDWYVQYSQAYLANRMGGMTNMDAHNGARGIADIGRPAAGSAQFKTLFDQVRQIPIPKGGKFVDQTNLYMAEGQYNFSEFTKKFADILVGGNLKQYVLNSQGTLFADSAGPININEAGAYIQMMKGFANDKIKLTVSGRFDKNSNFKGRFTPRATVLIKAAENHNFRLSYQTAYRFPSTQQQYINLDVGGNVRLLGGVDDFRVFYNMTANPVYTLESVQAGAPKKYEFQEFKPESVTSFEVGYKGLTMGQKLLIDVYGYAGQYTDFLTRRLVMQSKTGNPADLGDPNKRSIYSLPVNTNGEVKTIGFGMSLDYRLPYGFNLGTNFSSDELKDLPVGVVSFFNSPKYRFNANFGHNSLGANKRMGFNVSYRWQDTYFYQGDFASGTVPSIQTLDAQVSMKIPKSKSIFKLGANNLLNQYYYNAIGNAQVGGLYYVSFGYNVY